MPAEDPEGFARNEGLLEGLGNPNGPLVWADLQPDDTTGTEAMRRAGVLSGRIWAAAIAGGLPADDRSILPALAYASALSTPAAQRALGSGSIDGTVKAHVYACALGERHGHRYREEDERWLFGWLCERLQIDVTAALTARVLALRSRRMERAQPSRHDAGT